MGLLANCRNGDPDLDREYIYTYIYIHSGREVKPLRWVGSARRDLRAFPDGVRRQIGQALFAAQRGEEYPSVKALRHFGGRSVREIVAMDASGTYRAAYTIRFHDAIYVLHAFQKKSKTGIATPRKDIELIRQRLVAAEEDYAFRQN
jgi:phage-related protein